VLVSIALSGAFSLTRDMPTDSRHRAAPSGKNAACAAPDSAGWPHTELERVWHPRCSGLRPQLALLRLRHDDPGSHWLPGCLSLGQASPQQLHFGKPPGSVLSAVSFGPGLVSRAARASGSGRAGALPHISGAGNGRSAAAPALQ
jgi:hypothetical protein